MNTDIEYLKQLEQDLKDVAKRESEQIAGASLKDSIKRNTGRGWAKVAGVAAAFLIVAGAIGFVATGGAESASDKFQQVGDAVASNGHGEGGKAPEPQGGAPAPSPATGPADLGYGSDASTERPDSAAGVGGGVQSQQQDLSKIVRDGRIGIVVPEDGFGDAVGELTFIAEQNRGFILSSDTTNDRTGTFVLRIPARRFDRAIAQIRGLADRVRFQEIEGDDVTAEYIDFQARLRILKTRRALLFELSQQADTTEEILAMTSRLEDVQLRIEQIQGQLRFLNDQVSESTLRVTIQERNAPALRTETNEVDNPSLGGAFDLGVQGFLRIVGAVIVGLGYLIPLTALGVLAWLAIWFVLRRRATA